VQKSITNVPNQKLARRPKFFLSFFFFFFFFFFRQASSKLCDSFHDGFMHKTAAFYTEQCTSSSLFHNFEVSRGSSNQSLNNYGFISDTILKKHVRMCTNHLAMKQLLFKIAKLEIQLHT